MFSIEKGTSWDIRRVCEVFWFAIAKKRLIFVKFTEIEDGPQLANKGSISQAQAAGHSSPSFRMSVNG
jgi:hypothetical protein